MRNIIAITISLVTVNTISAGQISYSINDGHKEDAVTFTSEAPLETIVGKTSRIHGFVTVDLNDVMAAPKAEFIVDLASLKTGIGLRDKQMKENHLETEKFPVAKFVLRSVKSNGSADLSDETPGELILEGDFNLHGITLPKSIPAVVRYISKPDPNEINIPGQLIHIQAQFEVLLADYKIKRPQFLIMKLDEKQTIKLDFYVSDEVELEE